MKVTVEWPEGNRIYQDIDYVYSKSDLEDTQQPDSGRYLILPDVGWLSIILEAD